MALGISGLVACSLGEIAVRALHGGPLSERLPLCRVEANSFRGWQMIAGEDHYTYQHRVQINALGLRGPELPLERDPEERRVLALGDSMIYGQGVAGESTLPAQLEVLLNEASGLPWRVINAGHRAYSTNQELGLLREMGTVLDPDVVVLFWFDNDLAEYDIKQTHEELEQTGPRSFDLGTAPAGWALFKWRTKQVLRRSALIMLMHDTLAGGGEHRISAGAAQRGLERLGDYLDDFKQQCEGLGARPYFVVIPHSGSLPKAAATAERSVRAEAARRLAIDRGLPVVELEAGLRTLAQELGALPVLPYDGHYLPEANLRMAEVLAPVLLGASE